MKRRRLFRGVLVLILLFCTIGGAWKVYEGVSRAREYEEAAQLAGLPERRGAPAAPPGGPAARQDEPVPEEVRVLAGLDLEALREANPDVAAWIEIPGTEISYPVLQSGDNQYYLSHTWTKTANGGGSIFLECTGSRDFSDFHTIVYGHRMRDGSMFGSLKYYGEPDYWQEHPSVYVVTDASVCCYDIFAAQEASVTGIVYRLDLEERGLEGEFIRYCTENSVIDTGVTPEDGDRVLTLSTCTGNGYAARWVVHAALAREYERPAAH